MFLIPVFAGFFSGFLATAMGYQITEPGYWVISAPWILLGGLGYSWAKMRG